MSETEVKGARFATYPGDVTHMVGELVGPTRDWVAPVHAPTEFMGLTLNPHAGERRGEVLVAIDAVHDAGAGTTRVGFVFATPQDQQAYFQRVFFHEDGTPRQTGDGRSFLKHLSYENQEDPT
jgi:hypothetical protein